MRCSRRRALRGSVPLWLPVLLVGLLFAVGVRNVEHRARDEGYGWVDPAELSLDGLPDWADERWAETLEDLFASFAPFRTDDSVSIATLEEELRALPFIRSASVRDVLWPGGLEVEFELREPVACIPVGRHFLPVSDEGVVLPGFWTRPPRVEGRLLPVIAPLEDAHGIFLGAQAGDWLAEERHIDALAIVRSLRAHLSEEDQERMGRFSVLAIDARRASPDVPGAMLLLEGERRIWLGRPPADELLGLEATPGELPAWAKWEAVSRALSLLEADAEETGFSFDTKGGGPRGAWQVVDVRWDRPEILLEPSRLVRLAQEEALRTAEELALEQLPQTPPRRVYEGSSAVPEDRPAAVSTTPSREQGSSELAWGRPPAVADARSGGASFSGKATGTRPRRVR